MGTRWICVSLLPCIQGRLINKPETIRARGSCPRVNCHTLAKMMATALSWFCRIRSSVPSLRLFNANYFAGTVAATEELAFRNPHSAFSPTVSSCSSAGRAYVRIGAVFWRKSFRRAARQRDAVFGFFRPNDR